MARAKAGSTGLESRRKPVQKRAYERREAILDATARLLDTVGFAGTTTNAVGREAGASIGTVYEYFPNKEALFQALLERYRGRLFSELQRSLEPESSDWRALVGALFEVFVDFYRHQPGYRTLWLGSQLTDLLVETGKQWGDSFAADFAPVLGLLAPGLEPERRLVVTKAALHIVSGLVSAGLQAGDESGEAMIEEARKALFRYLEPELGSGREP